MGNAGNDATDGDPVRSHGSAYQPRRRSRSRHLSVRDLSFHVREWGPAEAPPLLMVHGASDASASFQFVVDAFDDNWHVIAPDWRGHGQTSWTPGSYWVADFLCDLDALWNELFADDAVPLVGHSMGANIAALYAAVRPQRVSRLVMLDSLGNTLDRSPVRIAETLVDLLDTRVAHKSPRSYASPDEMASQLMKKNRRLDIARASFIATAVARRLPDGGCTWPHDPTFHHSFPTVHSTEEWGECWQRITAPVLCLTSSDVRRLAATSHPEIVRQRAAYFRDFTTRTIAETGHNVHHDEPAVVAQAIQSFVRGVEPGRGSVVR
jgi:pimeloyl-ACP methyl ester carboxylesterase